MDFNEKDIDDEQEKRFDFFEPNRGDFLLKLKTNHSKQEVYVWRMIITGTDVRKIWPGDDDIECEHKNLFWGIDFDRRFITLCNDCENFAFGHKVDENA